MEAIAQGDVKAARKAAELHMENSEKTLLQAMEVVNKKQKEQKKSASRAKK